MELIQKRISELEKELFENNNYKKETISEIERLKHIIDNENLYMFLIVQEQYSEEDYGGITQTPHIIKGVFLTYAEAFEKGDAIKVLKYHAQFGSAWEHVYILPLEIGKALSSIDQDVDDSGILVSTNVLEK